MVNKPKEITLKPEKSKFLVFKTDFKAKDPGVLQSRSHRSTASPLKELHLSNLKVPAVNTSTLSKISIVSNFFFFLIIFFIIFLFIFSGFHHSIVQNKRNRSKRSKSLNKKTDNSFSCLRKPKLG